MGLDAYLYATTRKRFEAYEDFDRKCAEFLKWGDEFANTETVRRIFDSIPMVEVGKNAGCFDFGKMTEKQKHEVEWYKEQVLAKAKEFGLDLDKTYRPVFDEKKYGLGKERRYMDANGRNVVMRSGGVEASEDEGKPFQIEYFDRDWKLHDFIVSSYWKPRGRDKDNLVRIPLTKEDLREIAEKGYYPDLFRFAAKFADEDHVVYYFPWY